MSRWPPIGRVGMNALRHINRAETLQPGWVVLEEDLQFVHPLQVEDDRALRPIDLEAVVVAPSRCESRRLKSARGPVAEAREKRRRVIDGDVAHLRPRGSTETSPRSLFCCYRAPFNEGREGADNFGDRPDDVESEVRDMGSNIAQRP